jgi:hypothetical protein
MADNIPTEPVDLTNWLATSLTSKVDLRKKVGMIKDASVIPRLTDDQVKQAVSELIQDDLLKDYPSVERRLVDPPIDGQEFCVHSFVPSSGATPDEHGVYGIMKCRGNFSTAVDANIHAEQLIRDVDSFSKYFTGYVGKPFPVTVDGLTYSAEHEKVDLKEKVNLKDKIQRVNRENILKEREKEKVTTKQLKERSEKLQEKVDEEASDPLDEYIQTRVKRSHLIYTIVESRKKIQEYLKAVKVNDRWLADADEKNPDYRENFMDKYMEARRSTGVPDSDLSVLMYIDDVPPPHFWDGFVDDEEETAEEEDDNSVASAPDVEGDKILTESDATELRNKEVDEKFADLDEV